jgi:hypothetical protein
MPVLCGQVQSVISYVYEIVLLIQSLDYTEMTIQDRLAKPSSFFLASPAFEVGYRIS